MSDQPVTFSDYHIALQQQIRDLGHELQKNERNDRTEMSKEMYVSKIEGLLSLCQHALNLREEFMTRNQNTGVPLSDQTREWCIWGEEEIKTKVEEFRAQLEVSQGQ